MCLSCLFKTFDFPIHIWALCFWHLIVNWAWVNLPKVLWASIFFFSLWTVTATNTSCGLFDPLFFKSGCGLELLRKPCKASRVQIPPSGFGSRHRYVLKAFYGILTYLRGWEFLAYDYKTVVLNYRCTLESPGELLQNTDD